MKHHQLPQTLSGSTKGWLSLTYTLLLVLPISQIMHAQPPPSLQTIAEKESRQHLTEHADPYYPPIAKAAHVQGDVVLQVVVSASGKVTSAKVLSGPAMLQQAALDAVRKWHFSPFQVSGATVGVMTTLTLPFQIDKSGEGPTQQQQKAAQDYFPLADKCRAALRSTDSGAAVDACKEMLDMSYKAGDLTSSDQLGRLNAHQLYGHALLNGGKLQEAIEQENLAITEAKKALTETDEEYGMPFFWRAVVEARLGQVDLALADFQTAEEVHRKAMDHLPSMKKIYGRYLASILKTHAALLDQIGKSAEAEKLRTEATNL